ARRLSMAEPRLRVAAGAHPLLAVRQRVRAAAHHPDVLPGRSPAGHRSDLPERARGRPQSLDRRARPRAGPRGRRARVPLEHGAAWAARHADGGMTVPKPTPSQTVGPFFAREVLKALHTRVFLAPLDVIKDDPLARAIGDPDRLRTLIAARDSKDPKLYRWDVRLRGAGEAVFIEF